MNCIDSLRRQISLAAREYAERSKIPYYESLGPSPSVMFKAYEGGTLHGNFLPSSYKAILSNEAWNRKLQKAHQQRKALPVSNQAQAKELDSSNSSDALLMNVFCNSEEIKRPSLAKLFGEEKLLSPEFSILGKVPLKKGRADTTVIDMQLGPILIEAKLTEATFTSRSKAHFESYRDLREVFELTALPKTEKTYLNYQLVRNVLAAHAHNAKFFLICDARRPDLLKCWWNVMRCIRLTDLRLRCAFILWQEIAGAVGDKMQNFLKGKYGIVMK